MATLILFKEKGLREAEIFRGTVENPGDPPAEWNYLSRDPNLKDRISFQIIEYSKKEDIPYPYNARVKKSPFLTLSGIESKEPLDYPVKNFFKAVAIRDWIIKILASHTINDPFYSDSPDSPDLIDAILDGPNPIFIPNNNREPNNNNDQESLPEPDKPTANSVETGIANGTGVANEKAAGIAIGSSMILAGFVALGVILGNVLIQSDSDSDDSAIPGLGTNLLMVDDDGKPIDFSKSRSPKP